MGARNSTPTLPSTTTEQGDCRDPRQSPSSEFYGILRTESAASKSSSTATRATMLSRARLRHRRRRRQRQSRGGIAPVPVVVTVQNDAKEKSSVANRVAKQIVGETVLVYWESAAAWVECEVVEYGGWCGATKGLHRVRFADGLFEWTELKKFRLVLSAKRFARAMKGGKGRRGERGERGERGGRPGDGGRIIESKQE